MLFRSTTTSMVVVMSGVLDHDRLHFITGVLDGVDGCLDGLDDALPTQDGECIVAAAEQLGHRAAIDAIGLALEAFDVVDDGSEVLEGAQTMHQIDERVSVADIDRLAVIFQKVMDRYFRTFAA